jgi:hypothetical protein
MKWMFPCVMALGLAASCHAGDGAGPVEHRLSRLQVSSDGRSLVRDDGEPFFWLGDTAWGLPLLGPNDVRHYLDDRVAKRFTVLQVDCDGYGNPNHAGQRPFVQDDTDRPNEAYWSYLDFIVDEAERRGLVVALTVMWGAVHSETRYSGGYLRFGGDAPKAGRLGAWLGTRYRARKNVVWIAAGEYDSINHYAVPVSPAQKALFEALGSGLKEGSGGAALVTMHPGILRSSATDFHSSPWLSFDMLQSGHQSNPREFGKPEVDELVEAACAMHPAKPVLDGEPAYEGKPDAYFQLSGDKRPRMGADVVRRKAYWSVFAGAFGHTYGQEEVEMFWNPLKPHAYGGSSQRNHWKDVLNAEGATQMRHLRALMESRPMLGRIPDQSLILPVAGESTAHVRATRASDGRYAFIYLPMGGTVRVDLRKLRGRATTASWYDPRTGSSVPIPHLSKADVQDFSAPGAAGAGNDWVLVLDGA